jgi:hypothetical protein
MGWPPGALPFALALPVPMGSSGAVGLPDGPAAAPPAGHRSWI